MQILCTESVLGAKTLLSTLGDVQVLPDHAVDQNALRDIDVLIVRSGTRVDAALLAQTPLRIVATATAGMDHLDLKALQQHKIHVMQAQGSNAASVAEYVVHGLMAFSHERGWPLREKTMGLLGYGAVGRCIVPYLEALGIRVIAYDPLLPQQDSLLVSLQQLQQQSDMISLHCPLVMDGAYPTYHWLNTEFFETLKPGVLLINTARGAVVDTKALLMAIEQGHVLDAIVDVWEEEPLFSVPLMERVFLATPHIAGYSYTGRLKGTYSVYEQLCAYLQRPLTVTWQQWHATQQRVLSVDMAEGDSFTALWQVLKNIYDPRQDDVSLRALALLPETLRGAAFKSLRQHYPRRFEHSDYVVHVAREDSFLTTWLQAMAFMVQHDE